MVRELIADMKEKGQLEGVEIDVDDGYPVEDTTRRDEEILAIINAGILSRVKMYCNGDKYDAIVTSGGIEPGFLGARMISKIPVTGSVHSAVHVASFVGERFTILHLNDPTALVVRRLVQSYGFGHKLASVRSIGHSSPAIMQVLRKYKKGERGKAADGKKLLDDMVDPCIKGIEEDRADCIVFGCPQPQCLEDEIRQRLDELGYAEIPLVSGFRAAVQMAKAMVNLKLMQAPRAYPSDSLRAKPKFR